MDKKKLSEVLENHKKWIMNETGGIKANLSEADLRGANLRGANLSEADLSGANLSGADLRWANLYGANLCGANLSEADLCWADLCGANLSGADLCGANLSGADLCGANLRGVQYNEYTLFFTMQCPETGSYIGYKKASELIVKLEISEDAKRTSATSRKCRASKAKVLSITNLDGTESGVISVQSDYDHKFVYTVGKTVAVDDFCPDRWNECAAGIHHFITRVEAVNYDN